MGSKFLKFVIKVLIFAVYVLLILGIIGAIVYFVGSSESGMYVMYGTEKLVSGNSGITIEWNEENNTATFQIGNSDDWGVYAVTDCTAKIVPNVNDDTNFEYTISGVKGTQKYSSETDLTAAFVEDYSSYSGNGFTINEDGEFTVCIDKMCSDNYLGSGNCMTYMLYKAYGGKEITLTSAVDISDYPYFAIQVTPPDGGSNITIPFKLNEIQTSGSVDTETAKYAIYYSELTDSSFGYSLITDCPEEAAKGETVVFTVSVVGSGKVGNVVITDGEGEEVNCESYGSGMYSFVMPASAVDITFYLTSTVDSSTTQSDTANDNVEISYSFNPNSTNEIDLSTLGVTSDNVSINIKASGGSFYTATAAGDWTTGYTAYSNFSKTSFDSTIVDYVIKSIMVTDGTLTIKTGCLSLYSSSTVTDDEGFTTSYNSFVIGNCCYAKYTADKDTFEAAVEYNKEFNQNSYYICEITDNSTGKVVKSFCFKIYLTTGGSYDDSLFDIY